MSPFFCAAALARCLAVGTAESPPQFAVVQAMGIRAVDGTPGVELFRVNLPTSSPAGPPGARLSGLVAVPTGGAPLGLVLYYHSTTMDREAVPSRLTPTGGPGEAQWVVATFCRAGFAVVAPDMIGLGDDRTHVHPYALATLNYPSGLAMVAPARRLAEARGRPIGGRLYITGYSEGGAVAMDAARALETFGSPLLAEPVAACAPICGAYDLSGVEISSVLASQSNIKWLAARFFFAAYVGYGIAAEDPAVRLESLFVPSFASYIPTVFQRGPDDATVIHDLAAKGFELGAFRSIRRILQPSLISALERHDPSNPVVARLLAEDDYAWRPVAPLNMICLDRDFLVPPENSRRALASMRDRGVGPDLVRITEEDGPGFDHITFLPRGLALARDFFLAPTAARSDTIREINSLISCHQEVEDDSHDERYRRPGRHFGGRGLGRP